MSSDGGTWWPWSPNNGVQHREANEAQGQEWSKALENRISAKEDAFLILPLPCWPICIDCFFWLLLKTGTARAATAEVTVAGVIQKDVPIEQEWVGTMVGNV